MKSVKVFILCVSACDSSFIYLCASFSFNVSPYFRNLMAMVHFACGSSFVHLCASFSLIFHLLWEIWLHWLIYSQDKPCIFYNHDFVLYSEAVGWRCSVKKVVFLEILQNSQENTWHKKRLWHRCFVVNFAKFLFYRKTFFYRAPLLAASVYY